uniref:Cyclotide glopa B n=1 Tax=Gloeospermum pauciflorum TaxID=685569 RepID=CYGPB_GLOPU|nr:RecName: Full=Cyclotide glopa B [Gloeospermum pauciflorum]
GGSVPCIETCVWTGCFLVPGCSCKSDKKCYLN